MTGLAWLFDRPIAHRGLHDRGVGRWENTLAAADAAIAAGYGIECDIQLTADGEAVVFHDHALDRLTNASGSVHLWKAAELGQLSIGGGPDCIPTLAAFLDRIAGRVPLIVEVKSRFDADERLAQRLVSVLERRSDRVAVKSFDPAVVGLLRRIAPTLTRGIVAQSRYDDGEWTTLSEDRRHAMANLLHWPETEPHFLSWRQADLPVAPPFLARTLAGVPVMTWTVREQAVADRVRPYADQIVFEGFRPA